MKEEEQNALESYCIMQKVDAFARSYSPCASEQEATEVFSDVKLRQYFQAYPIAGVGDVLIPYIDKLEDAGFDLRTSITGEPAIFVCERKFEQKLLDGLTEEETERQLTSED